jgi:hypothetical protein
MWTLGKCTWGQSEVENFRYSEPYSPADEAAPPPVSHNYLSVWLEIALLAAFLSVAALWKGVRYIELSSDRFKDFWRR